jgi:Na+/melibiose symporter-like transporter
MSAVGAIFMKTLAATILRWTGFRRVLLLNALAASAMLCGFGLFRPTTPHLVIVTTLLISGCLRSLQFTSLNAISYAEVDSPRMGYASSLSGMLQQLSLSLGVAIAGYLLEIVGAVADQPPTAVTNFYWAFLGVGLVSMSSAFWMWHLPRNAGAEIAGRVRPRADAAAAGGDELHTT